MAHQLLPMLVVTFFAVSIRAWAADAPPVISAKRIKADVAYLASDRLEGRGPGTRSEELTTEYLANEFKKAGLKPIGERGSYLQRVPLFRVVTNPKSTLRATKGNEPIDFAPEEEFSGTSQTQIVVTGAERTTAWPTVKAVAEKHRLEIEADERAHLGIFYRSDHFSLARAGVPAFSWVVLVRGDKIAAAGPADEVKAPKGAKVIVLPGATLLPGLIKSSSRFVRVVGSLI